MMMILTRVKEESSVETQDPRGTVSIYLPAFPSFPVP